MNVYTFNRYLELDPQTKNRTEHTFIAPEDTHWREILLQFAMFLDTSGYVGVYENVLMMLEEE